MNIMDLYMMLPSVALTAGGEVSFDFLTKLIVSLVIGLIVGLIYAAVLKGQLTSVYKNNTAADYKRENSFKVTLNKDTFLYSKTEKTEIPQSNQGPKPNGPQGGPRK